MNQAYHVTVAGLLPLPNRVNAMRLQERMHRKREWREWTVTTLRAFAVPPLGAARVTFIRYSAGNPDATDALPAAFKAVRDALIGLVIDDDDDTHLAARYEARKCARGEAHIELRIEPWEGDAMAS